MRSQSSGPYSKMITFQESESLLSTMRKHDCVTRCPSLLCGAVAVRGSMADESSSDASDGSTTDTSRFALTSGLFMNGTQIPNGSYKCKSEQKENVGVVH